MTNPTSPISYDVALSFAGENRDVARQIADALTTHGVKVFYDEYEQATLWGKDLYAHLSDTYSNRARYCVMLLSKHYADKLWTNHERRAAQERAFRERQEYVLPIRLDDTSIPGILATTGYLDLRKVAVAEVVTMLLVKLALAQHVATPSSAPAAASAGAPTAPTVTTSTSLPSVPGASPAAQQILNDHPFAWEIKFFTQVLQDALADSRELKRDLTLGISIGPALRMPEGELLGWCAAQFASLAKVAQSLAQLVNVGIKDAMGPDGVPADPQQLFYIARRIGAAYKEAIEWSLRWRSLHVDDEYDRMISIASTFSLEIVSELSQWADTLGKQVAELPAEKPHDRDFVVKSQVTLRTPPTEELDAELERLRRLYARRR